MKRIVTLVLMMLIGGYGAVQAQTPMEMETATEMETAAQDFLGLKWGAGIGVMGGFGGDAAVEKASIVTVDNRKIVQVEEEGDLRPQIFLEMHAFLWGDQVKKWNEYQAWKDADQMAKAKNLPRPKKLTEMPAAPKKGLGLFVAVQGSDDSPIDALALGVMGGVRTNSKVPLSVNIGIGLSFYPSVQVLAKGFKDGAPPPNNNETAVRFKKEGRFGWALMTSFTF